MTQYPAYYLVPVPESGLPPLPIDPGFGRPGPPDPGHPSTGPITPGYPSTGPVPPGYPSTGPVQPGHPSTGPVPPGYPSTGPVPPGYPSTGPVPPGSPGHPSTGPVPPTTLPGLPPHPVQPLPPSGSPPATVGGKPGGIAILPMDPSYKPPTGSPIPGGTWVTLDAGKGTPPAWGYVAAAAPSSPDHGLGDVPTPTPQGGAPPPSGGTPGGHYVPIGIAAPKGGAPSPVPDPTWAWVPEIGPQFGILPPAATPKNLG